MKKLNRNSLENYIKLNKENCIKRNNEGITLIALIVTIVVMIVIAGVSINMTIGENGIFTKAVKAKEMQETAEIKEKFELKQAEARIALGGESLTLENYLKYLVDQGMIDESDIEDTADSNIKTILVDNKYIYTVVKKDDGSIGLEYEGKTGKLLPKIKSVNTKSTTSSIEVKVDATRVDGGEYRFYIKDVASGEDYKKKETNKTGEYIFTGLEQNREFKIKIEVENKNGIAESETNVIRTVTVAELTQADLEFTYNPNEWTKDKIVVTVNAKVEIPTGYTLQTSKDMKKWENTTTQEFTANGYIYVRLFDGTNGGSYAAGEVTKIDKEKPKITTTSSTSNSITFSGTDNASGIIGYKVTTSNTEPTSFDSCTSTTVLNNKKVTGLTANTTYYIWLKDAAGNISEAKTEKTPVTLVTSITLNKTTLTLKEGSEETLTATVNPTDATNKEITWSTSKSSVATVSTTGKITAVAAGTATITATAKDSSGKSASCTVTVTGVPYDNPYIPTGFTHIGKEDWNSGYRISDTGDETGNIFVWVPCVLDQSKVKAGDKVQTFQKTTTGIYNSGSYGLSPTDTRVTDVEPTNAIKTSVGTYGGFYIAAYEAGIAGTIENYNLSTMTATDGSVKPLSKSGCGVWNAIKRGNALTVAASMVNTTDGVKSGLISGECWDTTLQWMVNSSANATSNAGYDTNSTGKGWYSDVSSNTRHTTGYYGVNNIYDMAGNVWEWTTENCMKYGTSYVYRGGVYSYSGSDNPAASRELYMGSGDQTFGFRVVLYK